MLSDNPYDTLDIALLNPLQAKEEFGRLVLSQLSQKFDNEYLQDISELKVDNYLFETFAKLQRMNKLILQISSRNEFIASITDFFINEFRFPMGIFCNFDKTDQQNEDYSGSVEDYQFHTLISKGITLTKEEANSLYISLFDKYIEAIEARPEKLILTYSELLFDKDSTIKALLDKGDIKSIVIQPLKTSPSSFNLLILGSTKDITDKEVESIECLMPTVIVTNKLHKSLRNLEFDAIDTFSVKEVSSLANTSFAIINRRFEVIKYNQSFLNSPFYNKESHKFLLLNQLAESDRDELIQKLNEYKYFVHNCSVTTLDNKEIYLSIEIYEIYVNPMGEEFLIVLLTDITKQQFIENTMSSYIKELKTKEEEIKAKNLKIIESNKLNNLILANTSHELRTPLNAIIGFSDILTNPLYGELTERQSEYAHYIKNSGVHLLNLINDLLDLAKIESGKILINKETMYAADEINLAMRELKPKANEKNITIKNTVDSDYVINVDKSRFKQIINNLVSNAIKFTRDNGQIIIDSNLSKDRKFVEFSISDNGIGIKEKEKENIFKAFYQVDSTYTRKYEGTGLGLTIVKKLVDEHGGKIFVESNETGGSTFIFSLPLKQKETKNRLLYISNKEMPIIVKANLNKMNIEYKRSRATKAIKNVFGSYDMILLNNDLTSADMKKSIRILSEELGINDIPIYVSCFDNVNNIILNNISFLSRNDCNKDKLYQLLSTDKKFNPKYKNFIALYSQDYDQFEKLSSQVNTDKLELVYVDKPEEFSDLVSEINVDAVIIDFSETCIGKELVLPHLNRIELVNALKLGLLPGDNEHIALRQMKEEKESFTPKATFSRLLKNNEEL